MCDQLREGVCYQGIGTCGQTLRKRAPFDSAMAKLLERLGGSMNNLSQTTKKEKVCQSVRVAENRQDAVRRWEERSGLEKAKCELAW